MIGLAVLAGIAIYVGVWWFLVRTLSQGWAKALAILIALAIPFWDLPVGYLRYQNYCVSEGGLRISSRIAPQESVYFDSVPSYPANELIAEGIRVVEIARPDGRGIARHERQGAGSITTLIITRPQSSLRVTYVRNQRLDWNIIREDRYVRNQADARLLAQYSEFSWQGGWLQHSFAPILGTGLRCTAGSRDPIITLLVHGGAPSS